MQNEGFLVMSVTRLEAKNIHKAASIQFIACNTKELVDVGIILVEHHPHVSTICLPDDITYDQISQAFLICAYYKRSKTGGENGWGTKLPFTGSVLILYVHYTGRNVHAGVLLAEHTL